MIKKLIFLTLFLSANLLNAQCKKDKVLFTVEDEPVYVSEFLRVYNKNKDVVAKENKKSIDEYLELFINYKLKLRDAYAMKLDTILSYKNEFKKYKTQLIEPFLKDRKVSDKLVLEAYNRTKNEVRARHILIKFAPNASPQDTLKAFNKIIKAREKIIAGASFKTVAQEYSDDRDQLKKVRKGGDLGYFSAFTMLYPFENAAYTTKVGEVSKPFKTKYGYHILKVEDFRDSKGEIQVAHIMVADKKTDKPYAKRQINDIYKKMQQGEAFSFLAKKYSDDKASAVKGGVIRKFSQGKMIQPFADIAFGLNKIGDVSKPFQTKYGWHIVKLIKQFPVEKFETLKDELYLKVKKGDRSVLIGNSIVAKLKKKYKVKVYKKALRKVLNKGAKVNIDDETVFTIENKRFSTDHLKNYLSKNKSKNYKDFINTELIEYYKNNLEFENQEFANTLTEYRDGLLLFDLLQKKIWTKAEKDTIGLQNYFNKNKVKYQWKKRAKAVIASCTKLEKAKQVKTLMEQGKTKEQIKETINEGATIHVLFHFGDYEISSKKLPNNFDFKKGVSKVYSTNDNHFTIVNVNEVLASSQKELKDVRGMVISNYQNFLEKQWIVNLKKKYKVNVKKKQVKKIIKKYK